VTATQNDDRALTEPDGAANHRWRLTGHPQHRHVQAMRDPSASVGEPMPVFV
jgi:hypothetical protein